MLQETLACWFIFQCSPLWQGEHDIQKTEEAFSSLFVLPEKHNRSEGSLATKWCRCCE